MGYPETFKCLSDPMRREILILLRDGKMSAGEICRHFEVTDAAVSYHLKSLKKADLIRETKYKNFIFYELNTTIFNEIIMWFSQFKGGQSDEE